MSVGGVKEFARGEEVSKILTNGRMVSRSSIEVSEIRMREESDPRNREKNVISVRIASGWRGGDLRRMIKEEGRAKSAFGEG